MNTNEISGKRQLEFLADFDYIREAGTAGEEKAAERIQKTLDSFGVESHLEEFSFDTFQIKKAKLKVCLLYTSRRILTISVSRHFFPENMTVRMLSLS